MLLLDLPELNQIDETENIVRHLSPVMVLALKKALAYERIEEQTRGLERRVAERTIHTRSVCHPYTILTSDDVACPRLSPRSLRA